MSVLIIGAGPAGLALAACLKRRGVAFDLVDRQGEVGGAYHNIYQGVTLQSPARYTGLPGLKIKHPREYITAPEYLSYLERYADHHELTPRRAEVMRIDECNTGFAATFCAQAEPGRYAAVAVASGMYDFPVWPAIPGLAPSGELILMHGRDWRGPSPFAGRSVLVIGGATNAVEIGEECARSGQPVTISARSGMKVSPPRLLGHDVHDYAHVFSHLLPRWIAGSFCDRRPTLPGADLGFTEMFRAGKIDVRGTVERFEGKTAHFVDGKSEEFDVVVAATGYRFTMPFLPPDVPRTPAGHPWADDGESRAWPGLYFIGVPCGRSVVSEFLWGISKDAPALADRIAARLTE